MGALRYEFLRIRSLPFTAATICASMVFSALVAFALTGFVAHTDPATGDPRIVASVMAGATRSPALALCAVLLGVFAFGEESRHGTIIHALGIVANRFALFRAKALSIVIVCTVMGFLSSGIGLLAGILVWSGRSDFEMPFTPSTALAFLGVVVMTVSWGLIGLGLGAAISRGFALGISIFYMLVVEPILSPVLKIFKVGSYTAASFLPMAAGTAATSGGSGAGTASLLSDPTQLPYFLAALVLVGYVSLAVFLGMHRLKFRSF